MDGAGGRLIGIGAQGDGLRSVGQPREHPGSGHRSSQDSAALGWRGAELEKDTHVEPRSYSVLGWRGACCMERALWVLLGYAFSLQRPSAGSAEECNSTGAVNVAAVWVCTSPLACAPFTPTPSLPKEKKHPKKAIFLRRTKICRDHVDVGSGATKLGAASTSCPVYRHAVTRVRRRLRSRVAVCSATTAGAPRAGKAANREIGGEAGLGGQRDAPVVGQCVSGAPRKNSTCL